MEQVATLGSGFRKSYSLCKSIKFSIRSLLLLSVFCVGVPLYAQTPIPGINISVDTASSPQQVATTLQIVFFTDNSNFGTGYFNYDNFIHKICDCIIIFKTSYWNSTGSIKSNRDRPCAVSFFVCDDAGLGRSQRSCPFTVS